MKLGVGVLFVAIGLVILWAAVTGRLSNVGAAWSALKGDDAPGTATARPASGPAAAASAASRVAAVLNIPAGFPILTQSLN